MPTITLAPLPLLSDMPVVPIESDYEKIVDSSGDGEIGIVNVDQNLAKSMEYENHTKLTSIRLQQQSSDDDTELYATVDKIRTVNNGTRIKTNATSTIGSNLRQDSILTSTTAPSSQPIPSASLHSTGFTITPEHLTSPPLPPPPLPPLPLQVYTDTIASTIANDHDNISTHRPYYEEVIVRESLQDRAQYSPIEEDQNQQEQQLNENYYSSVNSERETTTSSDIYAEIANSSESGIVYQNPQYHYYSRPSNDIGIGDDTSEHYATVIELSNTEEDCTGSCLYQDVDS
ncbi:unnamed protein product [Rotaria sp. Silwood1]|nr:unnamed protein product [Rotaria sp. Silwood1]CAF3556015.1 unnamed protein product [Rotaria sp. Silwood1]CAF3590832.1 unnamed protein product [Rotaria sp. Silwood1]CAF4548970.1 unnamed protein product [Rotaria sp. Silwood1]CAF4925978.1 unnamed protein product [Rotaria sp. Silwood1]